MPVHIDEVTSDIRAAESAASAPASTTPTAPLPESRELWRTRLLASALLRNAARLRATDQDD